MKRILIKKNKNVVPVKKEKKEVAATTPKKRGFQTPSLRKTKLRAGIGSKSSITIKIAGLFVCVNLQKQHPAGHPELGHR